MHIATATFLAFLLSGSGLALSQTTGTAPGTTANPSVTRPTTPPPSATPPAATRSTPAGRAASTTAAIPAGGFAAESEAKAHCPSDTVVWANTTSKAYHMSGTKYYGKTKHGAYMCQKEADQSGYHAPKASAVQAKKKTPS